MKIIKKSGEIVDFNPDKLKKSLFNSGAREDVIENILDTIASEVHHGSTTKQIYKRAFGLLKKSANVTAARYNLREAIIALGPAGFYFEKYVSKLFEAAHYETKINVTLQGNAVMHEIDVLARKDNKVSMVECKFHGGTDVKTDVKVPMYILSRFNDLKEIRYLLFDRKEFISSCWIVTNNRFSSDAITFAEYYSLKLLSWDYPPKDNIKTKIDHDSLYPITCLTTLTFSEKDKLLALNLILVKDLLNNRMSLERIEISPNRIKIVLKEVSELCKYL